MLLFACTHIGTHSTKAQKGSVGDGASAREKKGGLKSKDKCTRVFPF